jgi:hypothetical protein
LLPNPLSSGADEWEELEPWTDARYVGHAVVKFVNS